MSTPALGCNLALLLLSPHVEMMPGPNLNGKVSLNVSNASAEHRDRCYWCQLTGIHALCLGNTMTLFFSETRQKNHAEA